MKGLSSTALAKTTNFAQPIPLSEAVSSAVFLIIFPIRATASMLIPAFVVATFTLEHTSEVSDNVFGIEFINFKSEFVNPL